MLRILSLLLGPIFAKEMVEIARRKRYYFNRVLYGAVLLFTLFTVFKSFEWQLRQGKPSIRLMAQIAERVFYSLSVVQFGAAFILVPLFVSGVVASEREERTLELLFTTRLSDRQIVLGKLGSRLAVLVLLILCGLPVISLITFFGGIDPNALWRVIAATLLAIVYSGAHAIYFSATTKSPMGAVVRTYWWMALWLFALPLAVLLPLEAMRWWGALPWALGGVVFLNPIGCFVVALNDDAYQQIANHIDGYLAWLFPSQTGWQLGGWFFPLTLVLPGAWSGFLIWRAVCRLRQAPTALSLWIGKLRLPWGIGALRRVLARLSARRRARAERTWYGFRVRNPLWLRARIARVYDRENTVGRIQWAAWGLAAFFLVLFFSMERSALAHNDASMVFLTPTWIAVAALLAILAGSSLVGDRRRGFLDLVLQTPLTAREVVDGTMLSVWQHLRRLYWLPWVLGLLFCLTGSTYARGFLCSMVTATLFGAVLLVHGIACSLTARTAPGALVSTFMLPLFMLVGLPCFFIFEHGSAVAVWLFAGLSLLGARFWVRRRATVAAVGCYFIAVHLALTALAACWTAGRHTEFPILAMHPGFLTMAVLETRSIFQPGGGGVSVSRMVRWLDDENTARMAMLLCYWTALTVNFLWARRWLIRHFDRLVERPQRAAALADGSIARHRRARRLARDSQRRTQPVHPAS
jgi:hypothetical protein